MAMTPHGWTDQDGAPLISQYDPRVLCGPIGCCHRKSRAPTEESWSRSTMLILILGLVLAALAILVDRCA